MKRYFLTWALDLFFATLVILIGFVLIGFYIGPSYLSTGYQDWIYHAFRVKSLSTHGLVSWDHIWSNGINHWSGYPFLAHYIVLGITRISDLSISEAMMFLTVVVFILIRTSVYYILRLLHIRPLYAFFAAVLSYCFAQQWSTISDFAIFIVMIFVPWYVYFFAKATYNTHYLFFLSAFSGLLWSIHPVMGYTLSGLTLLLVIFQKQQLSTPKLLIIFSLFLVGAAPFIGTQFFTGYSFANPVLSLPQFWKTTVLNSSYFGLSILYFAGILIGWVVIFMRADFVPRWAKILHLYCTGYLLFIWVVLNGYAPGIAGALQISRALPIIGFMLPFSIGASIHAACSHSKSQFIPGIIVAIMAVSIVTSIDIGSRYTAQPVYMLDNPVAKYFSTIFPQGSVYIENVAEASYFAPESVRYVGSYNEHKEPHPLGQRFKNLMRTDAAYTGVTQQQINLINAYSQVLGVEFLFLPELSPLVDSLTRSDSAVSQFTLADTVNTRGGVFSVLKANYPIHYAYIGDRTRLEKYLISNELRKPSLFADSYKQWDEEVLRLYDLIKTGELEPIALRFVRTDELQVLLPASLSENQSVLVMQSFDNNWHTQASSITIQPTSIRMMYLSSNTALSEVIRVINSWPWWYWPLYGVATSSVVLSIAIGIFFKLLERRKI